MGGGDVSDGICDVRWWEPQMATHVFPPFSWSAVQLDRVLLKDNECIPEPGTFIPKSFQGNHLKKGL